MVNIFKSYSRINFELPDNVVSGPKLFNDHPSLFSVFQDITLSENNLNDGLNIDKQMGISVANEHKKIFSKKLNKPHHPSLSFNKTVVIQSTHKHLKSWAKYLEQNREIQWNWTGQENSDIYFCVLLDCYCQSLVSGRETGHWAMFPPKFEIFLIFPYFLRS